MRPHWRGAVHSIRNSGDRYKMIGENEQRFAVTDQKKLDRENAAYYNSTA